MSRTRCASSSSPMVKAYLRSGKLTAGHARLLVGQPNAEELAEMIVKQGLNVRQVEEMARARRQAAGALLCARPACQGPIPTRPRWRSD